ncbi:hypothetical protein [Streptomyces sp. SID12501]|uniref:Uncharacterized protein n=1 Tax=Streptomyces sp. SID12501 TaxID=2706042 RepID=A0A6B3C5W6_9ACTN|nr:hypothetical protein [Streptomyces sp. SID12501]NEC92195.1 hypothetical protein [Streptomyces sp. SID12501]
MITTMDVETAEASFEEVRERMDRARHSGAPNTAEAVERGRRRLEGLRTAKERQDAALEVRKAAATPHAAELKKLAGGLDKSASGVAAAAEEARTALLRLLAVTEAHTGAVGAAHARLLELALPLVDEAVSQYEEGAGSNGLVCVGGRVFGPVGPDVVLGEVVARLVKAEFGARHPAASMARTPLHQVVAQGAPARELFARLAG